MATFYTELVILGVLTGFISAFFGIGGSSIDTPILRSFLHYPPYLALGTPLPLAILIAGSALWVYEEKRLVNLRVAGLTLAGGIPAVMIGSYLSQFIPGKTLMLFTAVILFIIGVSFLYRRFHRIKESDSSKLSGKNPFPPFYLLGVAAMIGLISGVLANGGGIFLVPAYVLLFRMPIKEAIATSLLVVAVMAFPSCFVHYCLDHVDLRSTVALAVGAVPMAFLGAKMDLRTRSKTIELLFGLILMAFSIYFFVDQLAS